MLSAKKELFTSAGGGYQISRSVRLRSSASAYFNRTFTTPTNAARWTFNRWVKRGTIGARQSLFAAGTSGSSYANIEFKADDTIQFLSENSAVQFQLVTTQVFRDPSAWYNIHIIYDSANATSTDRIQLWINGVRVTSFSTATYPTTTPNNLFNTAIAHQIGVLGYGSVAYFDGYQTELNFIDGQALTPSSFGETNSVTGVWQPKKYAGAYGTNGYYLNFSDNSGVTATTIGKDYSGNGNNWTPNNISITAGTTYDSMIDVPTLYADGGNGRGNYCTLNPLENPYGFTLSGGNLDMSGANAWRGTRATIGVTSGKWYWEYIHTSATAGGGTGISTQDGYTRAQMLVSDMGTYSGGWEYIYTGQKGNNNSFVSYGAAFTQNDVIGVAFDADAGTLVFYKNGVSQGTAYTGLTSGPYFPTDAGPFGGAVYNFGQRPFTYTPPTGFVALNTQNLPTPTISKGNQYMDVVLYTGNAVQDRAITGFGFDLDLAWIKSRNNAGSHVLVNSVVGGDKQLFSNLTNAEQTNSDMTNGFTTGGILVGDNITGTGSTNQNTYTYALWGWNAGGSTVTNTSGTISSQVRANATAGFSVVTYTGNGTSGATVGHGLGVVPAMMIVKNRSSGTEPWRIYHKNMAASPATVAMNFDTGAASVSSTRWNNTVPTSSVFTIGNDASVNANTNNYIAYCFAAVAGYSAFGSYTGNGSADGPFVFLGFRPRFVMWKRTDAVSDWEIVDAARPDRNVVTGVLYANLSNAEATSSGECDFVSNGFKIRDSSNRLNASGGTYIYMAFAENPFKLSLAR